ncbi:MAG TPA: nuclear transport factor 2 family protein [Nitrospirales bacterium]|jgi:ketosteroid isomerase-like protein
MKIWTVVMALGLASGIPWYPAESAPGTTRAKSGPPTQTMSAASTAPSLLASPSVTPEAAANQGKTDLRFVAVEIEGVKFWLGGGDIDVREFRASKAITFRLLNKLDAEHGFAIDALKIRQIVKPGEELILTAFWEDMEQSLSVYRYYCHLHPGHWGGTGVLAGKEMTRAAVASATSKNERKDYGAARTAEESPKAELVVLKGKLLKIEKGFYVIESAPGKEVRVSAPLDASVDENGKSLIGDWIEAQISSDLHVTSIKKSAARYMVEGDLIKTDGDIYVIADSLGNPIQLKVTKDTRAENYKIGDKVKAEFSPDGHAVLIVKKTLPASSALETTTSPEKAPHPAQEVLKLDRDWAGALVRRDTTTLERAMADDGIAFAWKIEILNKSQYLADIASGDFAFKSIEIDGAKARVYGDAVLVTGRYTVKGRHKEQDISGQHRYMNLYIKQQGAWRLVSQDIRPAAITTRDIIGKGSLPNALPEQ